MEAIFDWLSKFFESLTVVGWGIFVTSLVTFLVTSAIYLMKHGGTREAWFVVGLVGAFLLVGLRFGIPFATEQLAGGLRGSLVWVPDIQSSVREAFTMAGEPWGWNEDGTPAPLTPQPEGTPALTVSAGDVTIISTSGVPTAVPTSTPEAPTPTLGSGAGGGDPTATLTNEQAATAIIIQQMTATYTPRPPNGPAAEPEATLDMSIWNVMTPAPTRAPGG